MRIQVESNAMTMNGAKIPIRRSRACGGVTAPKRARQPRQPTRVRSAAGRNRLGVGRGTMTVEKTSLRTVHTSPTPSANSTIATAEC